MGTRKKVVKKVSVQPGICLDIPKDVQDILTKASPTGDMLSGIVFLAHSYDAAMEDMGRDEPHFTITPHEDNPIGDVPPLSAIEDVLRDTGEVRGSLSEVRLRVHDKSLPRGKDGLVNADYILVSNTPVMQDLLTTDKYKDSYDERFLAIREVLSKVPEDIWSGANIQALVDRAYQELMNGRRGTGQKT